MLSCRVFANSSHEKFLPKHHSCALKNSRFSETIQHGVELSYDTRAGRGKRGKANTRTTEEKFKLTCLQKGSVFLILSLVS